MHHKLLLFLLITMALTSNLSAQNQILSPELLWKLGRVGLECVSPDGQTIVYGVQRYDIATNKGSRALFSLNLNTNEVRRLTDFDKSSGDAAFAPGGQKIGYLMDGHLYEVGLSGLATPQKVSDLDINGFQYSPDGKKILFCQDVKLDPNPAEQYPDLPKNTAKIATGLFYRHWKSWHDYAYSNVFVANYSPENGISAPKNIQNERFDTPLTPDGGMEQITWDPASRFVFYTCRKLNGTEEALSTNSDIYAYEVSSGKTLNMTEDLRGYDRDPVFSPDGHYLIWTSLAKAGYEADRPRLMIFDTRTNQREELTMGWEFEANNPTWAADSKSVYFLSAENFTQQIYQINLLDRKIRRITQGTHDYTSIKLAGNQLVGTRNSMTQPAEIYTINPQNGLATQRTFITDEVWKNIASPTVERRTVKTFDGKDMNVWMVLPPNFDPAKKYPALVYCQGGPQSALSQFFSYRWNLALMASQGYVVVAPCRRGMPGSGAAWNDAITGRWGDAMKDYLSATDAAAKEPFIDAARMGAVGASFGGYSVYWLAGNHNKRFKAFISHCGLFNLESFYGTTEELWFPNHDFEGAYWQKNTPQMYLNDSPHRYVQNWDTPILVIHNELDFRVPFGEGMQAFQAAQLLGVPSRFLSFSDEGHWVSKPQNSLLWQKEYFGWLDKWLKEK